MGPSGNGLVERMKAGETPWNQGRSNGRPCPFPEGGPEDEGKRRGEAPKGAPVRVMDRPFPFAEGTGPTARRPPRAAFRTSACRRFAPPGGRIPRQAAGRPSPGTMEHVAMKHDERQTGSADTAV